MKSISLKLREEMLRETDELLERLDTSRNKYINEAIAFYNRYQKRRLLAEQLERESRLVWEDIYLKVQYFVETFSKPIRIDERSEEADAFLRRHKAETWAYITACNPMSEVLPEAENARRNAALERAIQDYPYLRGKGLDPEGIWPGEDSFFVAGITLDEASGLARRFDQRAIVFGRLGGRAELIFMEENRTS
jgi:hypothetical protein